MMKDIQIIDPCTSGEWREFIHEHPHADIFHHPAWLQMLRDVYGYRIFALCLKDGKKICAGLPVADVRSPITGKRWVAIPFSDHCRPLLPEDGKESSEILVGYMKAKLGVETPKIEIRWNVESSHQVYHDDRFVSHILYLENDENTLFKLFDKKGTQRDIKLAEKSGVVAREAKTYAEFEEYYRLQVITRQRLGVPAQPLRFFRGVWKYILEPGLGFTMMSYKDGVPIGGGVFFSFGKKLSYKYSASDRTYKLIQPNHAFLWATIRRAIAEGYSTIDFGRSEKTNSGLIRFKRGWATTEHELGYTIIANKPPKEGPSKMEPIIEAVIKKSPKFVCTLAGDLLYKHFA